MNFAIWLLGIFIVNAEVLHVSSEDTECPTCCILPKKFKNGRMSLRFRPESLTVPQGTVMSIQCRPKFKLVGKAIHICQNGKWLPKLSRCASKSCSPPPLLENGELIRDSDSAKFPANSRIKYQCSYGYKLHGNNELICKWRGSDLKWFGKIPICIAENQCIDPGVSSDGYREGNCCTEGSVLQFGCNPGFTLVGEEKVICSGEAWSHPRPLCQFDNFCPEPRDIAHGRVVGNKIGDFYQIDDQVSIECDRGYAINSGSDILVCEVGGWDDEFHDCTEIRCYYPNIPENGFMHEVHQDSYPFEFEVNFACHEGYLLQGNSWSACTELGWSFPSPTCRKIRCPVPPVPEGGWKRGDSYEVGDRVHFGCFSGYDLLGSSERECLPNGKWNGELSICNSKDNDCPNPGIPINGVKIGRFYKFGDVVEFRCNPGKELLGSPQRICQDDGEWSGSEVTCLDKNDFDQKESVSSRLQEIISIEKIEQEEILQEYEKQKQNSSENRLSRAIDLNHPDRLVFYFIFDKSGSIGSVNFRKSIKFAELLITKIGVSTDGSRVGAMTFSDDAEIIFYPLNYDTTEDVIKALNNVKFTTGKGTATRLALSKLKEEMIPLTEERLKGKQKPIVFLMTDGKANMEGDPMKDANELKKYGVEIYCIGITGDRNMRTLYDIASTKNEHVFILDDYDTIDWLIQQIINGSVDYSLHCGIQKSILVENNEGGEGEDNRGRIIGGQKALHPWPWMAALYFSEEDITKTRHRCGGSLIDKSWVLTAAHCFYTKSNVEIDKDNIIINLGLLNVRKRSNLQEFPIDKYIIHPEYKRKTHHNDIALIKLARNAEFNAFVRPVCLPPTDVEIPKGSKFYRDGENSVAIGWGYDKSVKLNEDPGDPIDHLKKVRLPLQNRITCINSLNNSFEFTDSMFCAGSGKGNEDTCKGDSGGPLMQPMVKLGQQYWTQVGIISWGVGCGQRGTYGFYTNVAKLKKWIETTLENN